MTNGIFHTIKSGWAFVYIEGLHVIISKNDYFFLKINFVLANSADPDEMLLYGSFWVFTVWQKNARIQKVLSDGVQL